MLPKAAITVIAVVSTLVLAASHVSAQANPKSKAKPNQRGCVSSTMEEGARSAYPAWYVCKS
jgi:hypothetical protein